MRLAVTLASMVLLSGCTLPLPGATQEDRAQAALDAWLDDLGPGGAVSRVELAVHFDGYDDRTFDGSAELHLYTSDAWRAEARDLHYTDANGTGEPWEGRMWMTCTPVSVAIEYLDEESTEPVTQEARNDLGRCQGLTDWDDVDALLEPFETRFQTHLAASALALCLRVGTMELRLEHVDGDVVSVSSRLGGDGGVGPETTAHLADGRVQRVTFLLDGPEGVGSITYTMHYGERLRG